MKTYLVKYSLKGKRCVSLVEAKNAMEAVENLQETYENLFLEDIHVVE